MAEVVVGEYIDKFLALAHESSASVKEGGLRPNGDVYHKEDGKIGKVVASGEGFIGVLNNGFKTPEVDNKRKAAKAILRAHEQQKLLAGKKESLTNPKVTPVTKK